MGESNRKKILIDIRNKVATLQNKDVFLVGYNSDYDVEFSFDEEWDGHNIKTAVFVFGNETVERVFEGNLCEGVAIKESCACLIGVYAGNLKTSTPACITDIRASILDLSNEDRKPPSEDVYDQIMDLINRYIEEMEALPSGGKAGQVLKKKTDNDFDVEWANDILADLTNYYTKKQTDEAIDGKIEANNKNFAPLVDGKVPAENLPLMYDVIITSQEQFLAERANFDGKKILLKDVKFDLFEIDLGNAEYVEFCNVSVGSEQYVVTIKNFKIGNFIGLITGWWSEDAWYPCDDLYIKNFRFVENLIPTDIHGSGDMIWYSGGFGMMNCAVSNATNCCNIINCHVIGRNEAVFTNCNTISNLHAKDFYGSYIAFENCTHLSNIALSGATVEYTSCSNVDPDTCDGYIGSSNSAGQLPEVTEENNGQILQVVEGAWAAADPPVSDVDKAYVDGLVGDIDTALDAIIAKQTEVLGGDF